MTDFERKPGGKRNLNANGSDPMMELTRLLQGGVSSPNQQGSAQGYDAPFAEDQQGENYRDPRFSNALNDPNYHSTGDEENYLPEGNSSVYQGENDEIHSGQDGNYWSAENTYPQQQNQYSENANYYSNSSEGGYEYDPSSPAENSYYGVNGENLDPQLANNFAENSNYVNSNSNYRDDNAQGFDWNDYNAEVQNNQYEQGFNGRGQNGERNDPSFYNESDYQAQPYEAQNYGNNAVNQSSSGSYRSAYEEHSDYNDSPSVPSVPSQFSDQNSTGQAAIIGEDGEFINSETQYWTNGSNDGGSYSDGQSVDSQWAAPFDENEQFANEFGVEPNQGVYRTDESATFLSDGVAVPNVMPNSPIDDAVPFNGQHLPYSEGPAFAEELAHDHSASRQSAAPAAHDMANEGNAQLFMNESAGETLEQARPLGAVVAPMRMATQPRSFLGYGQAVAVVPSRGSSRAAVENPNKAGAKSGFSLSRSNPVAAQKMAVEKPNSANSSSPIGRGVNPFLVGKTDQNATGNVAATNNSEFEDALNDFNLTIKGDQNKRYKRDSNLKTVRPDQNSVPETQSFDLPPVHYEDGGNGVGARNPLDQEFSDVLAPGVHNVVTDTNNGFVNSGLEDELGQYGTSMPLQGGQPLYSDGAVDASKYDWAASNDDSEVHVQKSGSGKAILLLLVLLAIVLACIGAFYAFLGDEKTSSDPVVIERDAGEVKVAPPADANTNQNSQDQAVYNRVESSNTPQTQQPSLIDHSEAPVDLDKVDEQAPINNETSLEPNSVESRVLEATQNSLAIHEVPTVTIRDNSNVNGDDINAIIASQQENVLSPGQSFKDHLRTQSNGQQASANDSLQAGSGVAANNSADISNRVDGLGQSEANSANSIHSQASAEQNMENEEGQANNGGLGSFSENDTVGVGNQFGTSPVTSHSGAQTNSVPQPENSIGTQSPAAENSSAQNQIGSGLPAGTFYVQIASQPSRVAAQQSLADIKRQPQINSVIGNHQVVIVAADIPGRGTYYRVRIAANNQANANQICNQLKDLQITCFVGK